LPTRVPLRHTIGRNHNPGAPPNHERLWHLEQTKDGVLDQHVSGVFPNDDTVVADRDPVLLRHAEARVAQLVRQGILVDLSRNPTPSVFMTSNAHPMTQSDIRFGAFSSWRMCVSQS
jgi:hypothetical protein